MSPAARSRVPASLLFASTIFVGAALLFLVQPMFARMALPLLGGAPAVWNTAMVFYQVTLLAGYGYAHVATRRLGLRTQTGLHLALLLAAGATLPIALPAGWHPPADANPMWWLLGLLAVGVGLPFFAVSTTSPLLQAWFARSGAASAGDPYWLYVASNLGSLLALLAYPALIEPALRLEAQSGLWRAGYTALVVLVAACGAVVWRARGAVAGGRPDAPGNGAGEAPAWPDPAAPAARPVTAARQARWVLLALAPSSLMLSVTTYLTTDIAAIPLLWVIPLSLYLLTFVFAFGRRRLVPHRFWVDALPVAMVPLLLVLTSRANEPLSIVIPTHLAAFFVMALACHGELAADRPDPRHLTGFYLWLAVGGALGGAFTALAAPHLFTQLLEYPLVAVCVPLLVGRRRAAPARPTARLLDVLLPLALGAVAWVIYHAIGRGRLSPEALAPSLGGLVLACLLFARRPLRFALGMAALLAVALAHPGREGRLQYAERSFFGVSRVTVDPTGQYRMLMHGTTLHGMQALDPARRREPLTYFHRSGPVGDVFAPTLAERRRAIAVVGLGAGALACHGRPEERWTFYEIDPTVMRIAADARLFSFLRDCGPQVFVRLGDARLTLARAPDAAYDLIVLDAYSSDAPPIHLITLEAVRLYLAKLAPGGLLLFNVSNRHLVLEPVLGAIARAAGLEARVRDDPAATAAEDALGKLPSQWVVVARRPEDLGPLARDPRWLVPATPSGAEPWTDDHASLFSAFRWR